MRRALKAANGLVVHHDERLDAIYKLDAVVLDRNRPSLPPVGLQFTTTHNEEKKERTIEMMRRTGIVARLLIRNGNPITSPDIIVEGDVLHITGNTLLTARAMSRVDGFLKRRAALRQRLSALSARGGPDAIRVGELRRTLDDDLR